MFDLLILNGTVITVDGAHSLYDPGFVAVSGGKIAALGPMQALPPGAAAVRTIDAAGHAVLPGLVDGHGHAGHCLLKTLGEQKAGSWTAMAEDIYFHYTDDFFWYAEGALAAAERLKFGVTTGVSMLGSTPRPDRIEMLEAHFEGSLKTGIRQVSGIGFCDGPWPKHPWVWENGAPRECELTPRQAVENTREAVRRLNGKNSRQLCIPAPGGLRRQAGADDETSAWANREMGRIAREYGLPLHSHSSGGEIEFLYRTTPEVLTPTTSLTHSTGLSQREIEIAAQTGVFIFHGPTTRANIRSRCPVYELLRAGANLAIVTDGTAPDRSYDIWRDMKVFQVLHRGRENDTLLAPPGLVLEMCTIRPARALGLGDKVGSLEVGKLADIILVDVQQPHLAPFGVMPLQRLVYHAQGQDVDTVIVEGQVVVENRRLCACDEKKVLDDAGQALEQLFGRLGPEKVASCLRQEGLFDLRATATDDAAFDPQRRLAGE